MPRRTAGTGRLFAEQRPGSDEATFQIDNTSEAYYASPYYQAHKDDLQPIHPPRLTPSRMSLGDVLSASAISAIVKAKRITFHAAGDMGAAKRNDPSTEASVADMMVADVDGGGSVAPSFLFHLGDVVYNFGEAKYYYDQFYEPLRAYDVRSSQSRATTTAWSSVRQRIDRRTRRSRRS
jgi:hypothetical protein